MQYKVCSILAVFALTAPSFAYARTVSDPFAYQWSYDIVDVEQAWDKQTGSRDVIVAIIDNGFDTFHPDLYPNVWKNTDEVDGNGIDDDANGYIDDVWGWNFVPQDIDHDGTISGDEHYGTNDPRGSVAKLSPEQLTDGAVHHATAVAGIVGAVGNNNRDGLGINWSVRLMNLKVLSTFDDGRVASLSNAIKYAVDNGADIINISLVGDDDGTVKAAVKYAYDHGVAVIAAAGNNRVVLDISPVEPVCADADENDEWILGVSAIKEDRYHADFANFGASCIDITAPGVNISSTGRYAPRYGLPDEYVTGLTGTSFAAPFVSGTAALLKAIQPNWSAKEIYAALLSTTDKSATSDEALYKSLFGAGLLNVSNAVNYAYSIVSKSPRMGGFQVIEPSGIVQQYGTDGSSQTIRSEEFREIDSIATYTQDGEREYIVTHYMDNQHKVRVGRLNASMTEIGVWYVTADGPVQVAVGKLTGGLEQTVVLAPQYSSSWLYSTYRLDGTPLQSQTRSAIAGGVAVTTLAEDNGNKVVTAYTDGGGVRISTYAADGVRESTFISLRVKAVADVAVADIDGDGEEEFILAGDASDAPWLVYLEKDGSPKRKFTAYDASIRVDLDIEVGDYDRDGKHDVGVIARGVRGSFRVWNDLVHLIFEDQPYPAISAPNNVLTVY